MRVLVGHSLCGQDGTQSRQDFCSQGWLQGVKGFGVDQEATWVSEQPGLQIKLPKRSPLRIDRPECLELMHKFARSFDG